MLRLQKAVALGMIAMVTLVLAACGSEDSKDASTASNDTSTASAVASTTSDAESGDGCVAEAQKLADGFRADVELKAPPTGLDMEALKGKTFWFINSGDTTFNQDNLAAFTEAGKAAGVNVKAYQARGTVNGMNAGVAQAVAQGADGIVLFAVDPELVATPLKKALDAGIPVVDAFNGGPDNPLDGLFGHVTMDPSVSGGMAADWMLADSECSASAAAFAATVYQIQKEMGEGAEAEFKRLCPDDCKISLESFDLAKVATELGTKTQSVLRRDSSIDYLFPVFDSGVNYVVPAVQQSGRADEIKIIGHDGVDTNLADIRAGGGQDATIAFPPTAWIGWAMFDQLARGALGLEAADWTIPMRLVDTTNIGEDDSELFPAYQGFQDKFQEAWNAADGS